MALINPIFSKEGAGDGLPLHYAALLGSVGALENAYSFTENHPRDFS
jgi:hypothetical protein